MTTVSTEVANACINQALAHTSAHDAERIATLEDLLRGREFAAAEHLETVKQQDKIIASLQAEIATARNDALEEAVRAICTLARRYTSDYSTAVTDAVNAIRALKQTAPADRPSDTGGDALASFTEYFVKNYPADTVIADPAWHAPRLFRAALAQSRAAIPAEGAVRVAEWTRICRKSAPMSSAIGRLRTVSASAGRASESPLS